MPTATSLVNRLYLTQKLKIAATKFLNFFQFLAGRLEEISFSTTYKTFFKVTLNFIKPGNKQSDADLFPKLHIPKS